MEFIRHDSIEDGLRQLGRVYLCGNLSKDNVIQHIPTDDYEIGISDYPEYTFEKAHIHRFNKEYNYILEGSMKIFLLTKKQEFTFNKGDLFVIDTNEPYVGKAQPGTRTLFSKVPGGNDKELIEMPAPLLKWGESWNSSYVEEVKS
ncbi:MAG: hypothetical protein K6A37_04345 [Saccharofermentans sp.]|nr:hypothetical protein [Saccharofermentans sp.]